MFADYTNNNITSIQRLSYTVSRRLVITWSGSCLGIHTDHRCYSLLLAVVCGRRRLCVGLARFVAQRLVFTIQPKLVVNINS